MMKRLRKTDQGFFQLGNKRFMPARSRLPIHHLKRFKEEEEKGIITCSVSSETPYYRQGWDVWEVLKHDEDSVNLEWLKSGRAPLLKNHQIENHIGVIADAFLSNKELYCKLRFKMRGEGKECYQDISEGFLSGMSISYEIYSAYVEEREGEDYLIVDSFSVLEVSATPLPADQSVGVTEPPPPPQEDKGEDEEEEEVITEKQRRLGIERVAKRFNIPRYTAEAAIKSDKSLETIFQEFGEMNQRGNYQQPIAMNPSDIDNMKRDRAIPNGNPNPYHLGLSQKDKQQYSIAKVLRYASGMDGGEKPNFEIEISEEIARRSNRPAKGLYLPTEVITRTYQQRDGMGVANNPSLVGTETLPATSVLRPKSVLPMVGTNIITGASESLSLPRGDSGTQSRWLAEGEQIPQESLSFDPLTLSPHTVASLVTVARKLVIQASFVQDIETQILNDIFGAISSKIQKAALRGGTEANEPEGIVASVDPIDNGGDAVDREVLLDMESAIAEQDADIGQLSWIVSPKIRRNLRAIPTDPGSGHFLYNDPVPGDSGLPAYGDILGYPAYVTSSISDNFIIFGDFSQLMVVEFGAIDLTVNPYAGSAFSSGNIMIRGLFEVDCGLKRRESFAVLSNFSS